MSFITTKVEARGLRDLKGRFGRYSETTLRQRRQEAAVASKDALLRALAQEAPRSDEPDRTPPAYADSFQGRVDERGNKAIITIGNPKTAKDRITGKVYFLNDILIKGRKELVPVNKPIMVFTWKGLLIKTKRVKKTEPSDFVQRALRRARVRPALNKVAERVRGDFGGR